MVDVEILWQLQELEQEWEKIKKLQKKNAVGANNLKMEQEIAEIAQCIQLEGEIIAEVRSKMKEVELKLQSLASEKKEVQNKLYSGDLNQARELEIWQDKLDNLRIALKNKEEEIVDLMEILEKKEKILGQQRSILELKKKKSREEEENSKILQEKIKKRLAFLQQKKKKIIASLGEGVLDRYENLRKKFGLGIVAKLRGEVCQGCHMALSTGLLQIISSGLGLHNCENCGRILYID